MVTAPEVGTKVFNPDEMSTPEQRQERLEKYVRAVVALAENDSIHPAEKGAMLADAFSELTQDRVIREAEIAKARAILERVIGNSPDIKAMWTGLIAELASADLLTSMEGIAEVDYPSIQEDMSRATDWKAKTEDGQNLSIQTKTISLAKERKEMGESALPILSSVKSVDELKSFLMAINKVSLDFVIYHDNKRISIDQLGQETINYRKTEFSIVPDPDFIRVSKDQDKEQNNRLEELSYQAVRMHCLFRESDEVPVICLLGAPGTIESDVNSKLGQPKQEAQVRAANDLDKIISIDK